MSETVWVSIIGACGVILGAFLGRIMDWIRGSRQDSLTAEEIEQRINKSRLDIIADLQVQLGTATKAEGELREELNRIHKENEQLRADNSAFNTQLTAYTETIAENSKTISDLMIEKRNAMNDMANWQRKYLDAMLERDSFLELLRTLKERTEIVGELKDKIDAMEKKLSTVKNDTDELKQKTRKLS